MNWLENFKHFFSFFIGTNVYKSVKYMQFRCNLEDKMDKKKSISINLNGLLRKINELVVWIKIMNYNYCEMHYFILSYYVICKLP